MEIRLFSGNAHPDLARRVAEALGVPLGQALVDRFPDGEVRVRLLESVRGDDVYLVQPTSPPVNDHLMELLLLADAARRSSAARINAVIPYFGYAARTSRPKAASP
jgi:ribose-phosphate pyrophosphokinase